MDALNTKEFLTIGLGWVSPSPVHLPGQSLLASRSLVKEKCTWFVLHLLFTDQGGKIFGNKRFAIIHPYFSQAVDGFAHSSPQARKN
jgi:hypothetical protein